MSNTLSRSLSAVTLAAGLVASFASSAPQTSTRRPGSTVKHVLYPIASDRELEKQIGEYLKDVKGWKFDYRANNNNPDDLYLRLLFTPGKPEIPTLPIVVDCGYSKSNPGQPPAWSSIEVYCYYTCGVKVEDPRRARLVEGLNQFHVAYRKPDRVYLDKDGDLVVKSTLFTLENTVGLDIAQIADAINSVAAGWDDAHEALVPYGLPPKIE